MHLGVIQLHAKMANVSSKKDLESKITEDTSGKHKRGRQRNMNQRTCTGRMGASFCYHRIYTCIGICFSSWHSALGGETADALGCSGPSFFQLVRYHLRDLCKHHIVLVTSQVNACTQMPKVAFSC